MEKTVTDILFDALEMEREDSPEEHEAWEALVKEMAKHLTQEEFETVNTYMQTYLELLVKYSFKNGLTTAFRMMKEMSL